MVGWKGVDHATRPRHTARPKPGSDWLPWIMSAFYLSHCVQVNIYCDCPLWPDDSMCALRACSVCECEQSEVPPTWRRLEQGGQGEEEEGSCNSNTCEPGGAGAAASR